MPQVFSAVRMHAFTHSPTVPVNAWKPRNITSAPFIFSLPSITEGSSRR